MLRPYIVTFILLLLWCQIISFSYSTKNSVISVNDVTSKPSIIASQQEQLRNFWSSINSIENHQDQQWIKVADEVAAIAAETDVKEDVNCFRAIEETFRRGLKSGWSSKLITANSFSKRSFASGLVAEEFSNLGDFDDCLAISVINEPTSSKTSLNFNGKYCLVNVSTPLLGFYGLAEENAILRNLTVNSFFEGLARSWLTVRNRFPFAQGICVPSICSTEAVERLIGKYFSNYTSGMEITVGYCQEADVPFETKPGFLVALSVISLALLAAFLGTLINLPLFKSFIPLPTFFNPLKNFLTYFDVATNFRSLFEAKHKDKNNRYDLRFIHGLKSILIIIMSVGHAFAYLNVNMLYRISTFRKFPTNAVTFLNENLLSGFWEKIVMMISMFFIISGFLTTYITFLKVKRTPAFGPFVLLRWLFLLPSVIGTLCFTILFQYLGTGPMFHPKLTDPYVAPCHTHWWTHLLFINNFWSVDQMCGINLWFIAVSLQLHIILYLVVFFYFRKKSWAFITATLASCTTFLFLVLFWFNLAGVPLVKSVVRFRYPFPAESLAFTYMSPLLHFMPYFFGVLIALLMLNGKFGKISDTQNVLYSSLWGLFVLALAAVQVPEPESANIQSNFFANSLTFFVFAGISTLNASWFLAMILTKTTSIVKQAMSLHLWLPLSRLSFGIYLLNPLLIWYNVHLNRAPPTLSIMNSATFAISIYLQGIVLAIVLFLIFEAPFGAMITDLTRQPKGGATSQGSNLKQQLQVNGVKTILDVENNIISTDRK